MLFLSAQSKGWTGPPRSVWEGRGSTDEFASIHTSNGHCHVDLDTGIPTCPVNFQSPVLLNRTTAYEEGGHHGGKHHAEADDDAKDHVSCPLGTPRGGYPEQEQGVGYLGPHGSRYGECGRDATESQHVGARLVIQELKMAAKTVLGRDGQAYRPSSETQLEGDAIGTS